MALSAFGLRRAHYITSVCTERQLVPDPKSAVRSRLRLDRRHPAASRIIVTVPLVMLVPGFGRTYCRP